MKNMIIIILGCCFFLSGCKQITQSVVCNIQYPYCFVATYETRKTIGNKRFFEATIGEIDMYEKTKTFTGTMSYCGDKWDNCWK